MAASVCSADFMASGSSAFKTTEFAKVDCLLIPNIARGSKHWRGKHPDLQSLPMRQRLCISAQYDGRRGSGSGEFLAGFVLGGVVFGALGYLFSPQVSKTLARVKDGQLDNISNFLDVDDGIEKTRRNLNEKIAKLNSAIDDVSAQLKAENGVAFPDDSVAELESAA